MNLCEFLAEKPTGRGGEFACAIWRTTRFLCWSSSGADLREAIVDTSGLPLEAHDGQSALACLKAELVGLVLSRCASAAHRWLSAICRNPPALPGIPFILMTAYGVIERAIELFRNGASHYLLKPFEPDVLTAEVKNTFSSRAVTNSHELIAHNHQCRTYCAWHHGSPSPTPRTAQCKVGGRQRSGGTFSAVVTR